MAWLILLAMFLVTALMTYGLFSNINYDRRRKEKLENEEALRAVGAPALSTRLALELQTSASVADGAESQEAPIPYGFSETDEKPTRSVQFNFHGTTTEDVQALEGLLEQELKQTERAERQGLVREAEIHRAIATGIEAHLRSFQKKGTVQK